MRSFAILLLCCATAVLAASTKNDDQKKDKRHLLFGNHGVSIYSLPYGLARYPTGYPTGYSTGYLTGYPTEYSTGYPTGLLDTRVLGAGVPLDNSLVLVYPSGWKYEDLLYKGNFGNVIGLNELSLFAQPSGLVNTLPPILARDEISERTIHAQVPFKSTLTQDGIPPALELMEYKTVMGGVQSGKFSDLQQNNNEQTITNKQTITNEQTKSIQTITNEQKKSMQVNTSKIKQSRNFSLEDENAESNT